MTTKKAAIACAVALCCSCSMLSSTVTADQYNRIQDGMTYREVVEIMGSPGDSSVNEAAGEYAEYLVDPKSMGKFYGWGVPDDCFVVVGFENDADGNDANDRVDMKGQDPEGCLQ